MIGKKQLNFKFKKLYHGDKDTGYSVVPGGPEYKMWKVSWPDGVLSDDYYNLTRAKDHAASLYLEDENKAPGSPADAFVGGARYHGSLT